jgi:hypothetical protein
VSAVPHRPWPAPALLQQYYRAFVLPLWRQPARGRARAGRAKDSTWAHSFGRCPPPGPAPTVQTRNAPSAHCPPQQPHPPGPRGPIATANSTITPTA